MSFRDYVKNNQNQPKSEAQPSGFRSYVASKKQPEKPVAPNNTQQVKDQNLILQNKADKATSFKGYVANALKAAPGAAARVAIETGKEVVKAPIRFGMTLGDIANQMQGRDISKPVDLPGLGTVQSAQRRTIDLMDEPGYNTALAILRGGSESILDVVSVAAPFMKAQNKIKAPKAKNRIQHSEAFDVTDSIKQGEIPRDAVYKPGSDVLQPNYAKGRIDDVAQKLDDYSRGLGDLYRKKIDVNNTTMDEITNTGLKFLQGSNRAIAFRSTIGQGTRAAVESVNRDPITKKQVKAVAKGTGDVVTSLAKIAASPELRKEFGEGFQEGTLQTASAGQSAFGILLRKIGMEQASQQLFEKSEENRRFYALLAADDIIVNDERTFAEKLSDPEFIARGVSQNLPNMLASLGVAVPVGVLTGGSAVAAGGAAFLSSGALEGGFAYNEAIDYGLDQKKAENVAAIVGMANGLLEALPIGRLVGAAGDQVKNKVLRTIVQDVIVQATLEGGTESLQEIVSNAVAKTYDENRNLFDGVPEAALFGTLTGGLAGGSTVISQTGMALKEQYDKLTPAQRQAGFLDVSGKGVDGLSLEAKKYDTPEEFVKAEVEKRTETISEPITVYRGTGKGIGNTTLVVGRYFADSKEFAENFGDVTTETIPAGAKVFDLDTIKYGDSIVSDKTLVSPADLTDFLLANGVEYTKNTNSRGVEYVKLAHPASTSKDYTNYEVMKKMDDQYRDIADQYKTFNAFYKAAEKRNDARFAETGQYQALAESTAKEYFKALKNDSLPQRPDLNENKLVSIWNQAQKQSDQNVIEGETEIDTRNVPDTGVQASTQFEQLDNALQELEMQIAAEFEIAQAGQRLIMDYGADREIVVQPSTFPDWIPSELRSKRLMDTVLNKMAKNEPMGGSRQQALADVITEQVSLSLPPNLADEKAINDWLAEQDATQSAERAIALQAIKRYVKNMPAQKTTKGGKTKKIVREQTGQNKKEVRDFAKEMRKLAAQWNRAARFTKADVRAVQAQAIDMVQYLPLRERAKFLKTVKNIQSVRDLKKAMPVLIKRANKLATQSERRSLLSKIAKEIKKSKVKKQSGKPKGKFGADAQKMLDRIRENLQGDRAEAQAKIADIMAGATTEDGTVMLTPEQRVELAMLDMVGVKEMTNAQLKRTLMNIQSIKENGRTIQEIKEFNRQSEKQRAVEEAIKVITGGKGLPDEISTVGTEDARKRADVWLRTTGSSLFGWTGILDMLSFNDKGSKQNQSFLNKFGDVSEQNNAVRMGEITANENIQEMARKAFGFKTNREVVHQLQKDSEVQDLGTFKRADNKNISLKMSKSEARKRWMELQDPTLMDTFTESMGYTGEMIQAIENFLTPADKRFAQAQLEYYRNYYEGVNEIYREMYGVDLPFNPMYSPIRRDVGNKAELVDEFMKEIQYRRTVTSGSLKSRVNSLQRIKTTSDVDVLQTHISEMEHFKAWAEKMRTLRDVFDTKDVQDAITHFHGAVMNKRVQDFLKDFAAGGRDKSRSIGLLNKLRINFTRGVLSVKPSILAKQLSSFVAYLNKVPTRAFLEGMVDLAANPIKHHKFLMENSALYKTRGANVDRDIKDAMRSGSLNRFRRQPSFLNMLMLNVRIGDKGAILLGGWSVYRYHYKKSIKAGMTKEEAIKVGIREFEAATTESQQSGDISEQSHWQRAGDVAKIFTMFKSSPNQYFRIWASAIRNMASGRITTKQFVKTMVVYQVIMPTVFQLISNFGRWDDKDQLRSVILGPLNGIFILGDFFDTAARVAIGQRRFDFQLPIYDVFEEAIRALEALVNDDGISEDDLIKAIEEAGSAAGSAFGLPSDFVITNVKGIGDIINGDVKEGVAQLLGWSKWAIQGDSAESSASDGTGRGRTTTGRSKTTGRGRTTTGRTR